MGASEDTQNASSRPTGYERSVLEAVIETVPNGILVVDENREFFTYNERFVEMWDIPANVVAAGDDQRALDSVLDSLVDPSGFLDTVEYFYDNPRETGESELELDDGRIFERYTAPALDAEGAYYGRVWVFEDVTERVRNRRELRRTNERLEAFMSVLAHDLRSPLNVAAGRTELAREETGNDHLDPVVRAHDRMETMLEDLLALARGEEGPDDVRAVSLAELVRKAWANTPTADATLRIETERSLRADPRLLRELLRNLLANAVHHGGDAVTVTVDDLSGGFAVADDGPGVPEFEREDVFEARYTTKDSGTGLGLSVVSQVVNAHDWTVDIAESNAGGARFEVTGVDSPGA